MAITDEDRRVAGLRAEGKSWHEIARIMATNDDGSDPALVDQLTQLQNERGNIGNGATAPGEEPTVDPQTDMVQTFHAQRALGVNREDSTAAGLEKLFAAAANGDERVASDSKEAAKAKFWQRQGLRAETHVSYRR